MSQCWIKDQFQKWLFYHANTNFQSQNCWKSSHKLSTSTPTAQTLFHRRFRSLLKNIFFETMFFASDLRASSEKFFTVCPTFKASSVNINSSGYTLSSSHKALLLLHAFLITFSTSKCRCMSAYVEKNLLICRMRVLAQ